MVLFKFSTFVCFCSVIVHLKLCLLTVEYMYYCICMYCNVNYCDVHMYMYLCM